MNAHIHCTHINTHALRYIFGKNRKRGNENESESISMTAPVRYVTGQNGGEVSFMMPGKYHKSTLPLPQRCVCVCVCVRMCALKRRLCDVACKSLLPCLCVQAVYILVCAYVY